MPERTRTRKQTERLGSRPANTDPSPGLGAFGDIGFETVTDVVEEGDNHPFTLSRKWIEGGRINEPRDTSVSGGVYFVNYLADWLRFDANPVHLSVAGIPNSDDARASVAARTNPSRPYVDLPVAIKELADIPLLVRDSGRTFLAQTGGGYLKYKFGIAPLASDIAKMWKFAEAYKIRVQHLNNLAGPRSLRRTIRIGSWSNNTTINETLQSNGALIRGNVRYVTTITMRGHARWKLSKSVPPSQVLSARMRKKLFMTMLGLRDGNLGFQQASQLWEALPWTWLIDWCGNVGDYLMLQRNQIPAELSSVCVTKHERTVATCPRSRDLDAIMSPFRVVRESKTRRYSIILPTAHLPILDSGQVGILAALLSVRKLR